MDLEQVVYDELTTNYYDCMDDMRISADGDTTILAIELEDFIKETIPHLAESGEMDWITIADRLMT